MAATVDRGTWSRVAIAQAVRRSWRAATIAATVAAGGPPRLAMRPRGRVLERRPPSEPVPPQPLVGRAHAHARGGRRLGGRPLFLTDSLNDQRAHVGVVFALR